MKLIISKKYYRHPFKITICFQYKNPAAIQLKLPGKSKFKYAKQNANLYSTPAITNKLYVNIDQQIISY